MPIIAAHLQKYPVPHIVVDPVLVNHKGQAMFPETVTQAYKEHLFPLAELVTPNCREAEVLTGLSITTLKEMESAAAHLHTLGPQNVLIKRGHDQGEIVDVLFDGNGITPFRSAPIKTQNTHGSGDMLSSAICAFLAQGMDVKTAVAQARALTHTAIQKAALWQLGSGHGPLAIYDQPAFSELVTPA